MYREKLQQATQQDQSSNSRFNEQRGELELLAKTKQELIEMMPVSQASTDVAAMPASVAIKNALTNLETAKKRKNEIMSEVVQELANLNMVEQLMTVHQGNATKDAVFNEMKTHYTDSFARLNEQQDLI